MEIVTERHKVAWWIAPASVLCGYGLLLALTASADPGDTRDYAKSIVERFAGRDLFFWEAGHLLWRPLGYLLVLITQPSGVAPSSAAFYAHVVHTLSAINIAMGAVALLAFLAWARRSEVATIPAIGATLLFATTCAFLNYAQAGTAYIPSIAMLVIGLWSLAAADSRARGAGLIAAVAFALSVLFWLPTMFAIPVAAATPLILRGDDRRRRIAFLSACVVSGAIVIVAYLAVALLEHVRSMHEFRTWMSEASHGIQDAGGLSRAVVGFARSVLSVGELGITAKRYLLHDPFVPTTAADVLRAGLYRVALFYGALGVLVIALAWKWRHVRVLIFLALAALPVLVFAVAWQGGDLERYFALFPALFLATGVALSSLPQRQGIVATVALVALTCALNLHEYSRAAANRSCETLKARLSSVPSSPAATTLVVTLNADELTTFRGRCPDAPELDRPNSPGVLGIFTPHTGDAPHWRQFFATRALERWKSGGRVMISSSLLAPKPPAEWHWAEGDDPRVHWREFPVFFNALVHASATDTTAPFVEVMPDSANTALLTDAQLEPRSASVRK